MITTVGDPVSKLVCRFDDSNDSKYSEPSTSLKDSKDPNMRSFESYREEKHGIESLDTYRKITLGEYRALREKGAPKAIPTMCVLTIKKDENLSLFVQN